jgi:hypothetical protein
MMGVLDKHQCCHFGARQEMKQLLARKLSQFRITRKKVILLLANLTHMNAHQDTDVLHDAELQKSST